MMDIGQLANAWAAAWMSKDADCFLALFAPDAIYRDDQAGRSSRGLDELRSFHSHFSAALSDFRLEIVTAFMADNLGCLEWISSGAQTGTYHGRPPTGKTFNIPGATVLRFAPNQKILSCVDYYDGRSLARQLGDG